MKRYLRLRGAAGKVRHETYMGADHLVVPVIALVEGVIWPVNSDGPELVLAEELAIAPMGWNGRPIFADHPADDDDQKVSGNNPETLEVDCFGIVFNTNGPQTVLDSKRLAFEAWLNLDKAPEVEGAMEIIERLEVNDPDDPVEVSVGVFVRAEQTAGEWHGQSYDAIWRNIVPDHLAMLPEGMTGACSVAMGCGSPRVASVHLVTANGLERIGDENMTVPKKPEVKPADARSLRERLMAIMRFRTNAGEDGSMSDADLRSLLDSALRAVEPGYWGIDSVFPEQSLVVYAVAPENEFLLFQRSFVFADGSVTLNDDKVEVTPVTIYEPVTAAEVKPPVAPPLTPTTAAACGCKPGGTSMKVKAERVAALIASSAGKYTDADKPWLSEIPDARFEALETAQQQPPAPKQDPPKEPEKPVGDPPKPAEPQKPVTAEAYLATLPPSVAEPIREGMKAAEARKNASIKALKDSGRCKFSDEQLNAKAQSELDNLMDLAGVTTIPQAVDFSLQNSPRTAEGNKDNEVPAPPDMYAHITAAHAKERETA